MKRAHRAAHRKLWPLLGLVIGAGLLLALVLRPPPEPPTASAAQVSLQELLP
jgi:hypothetical protein